MKNIEENITKELKNEPELIFNTSDDDLFKRATTTTNKQQGTKDIIALGLASIWVVFISIFMKILKPLFTQMAAKSEIKTNTTDTTNTTNKE